MILSNDGFKLDEQFTMDVMKIQIPVGSKFYNRNVPLNKLLHNKKYIIVIKNNDNLCMARALVKAKAKIENPPEWNNIRNSAPGRDGVQRKLALELCESAGVDPTRPSTFEIWTNSKLLSRITKL